ncbi:unnamed protein product, partial [marine sediment metagenome]
SNIKLPTYKLSYLVGVCAVFITKKNGNQFINIPTNEECEFCKWKEK